MLIKHNMTAMNAQRHLGITGKLNAKSAEKLSSGYKINRAADDAAGLAISEKMRRQIRGLKQGIANTQDGISLCQVADGALAEVHEMLHRITELSVKAANGTNSQQDRQAIQKEITQILAEIDRVGDTTTFNDRHVFKGTDIPMYNADGTPVIPGRIPVSDLKLADLDLGRIPFGADSDADHLKLQAIVDNADSKLNGQSYNLIFGSGSTSHSSMRISYQMGTNTILEAIPLKNCTKGNYQADTAANPPSWSRDFTYSNSAGVSITITQKVTADSGKTDEKYYGISYQIRNTGTMSVNLDFQFHTDTAYNNNDRCEGYFIDGNRVDKSCIYSEANSPFTSNMTNSNIHANVPDSLSIVDVDNALAFSEKIVFDGSSKPDSFSIGHYNSIHNWSYYSSANHSLGQNMIRADLGFSLLWNDSLNPGTQQEYSFKYGIIATEKDNNLKDVPLVSDMTQSVEHIPIQPLWIQSRCDAYDGIWLELGEMNSAVIGIDKIDISTVEGACDALDQVEGALQYISGFRSRIGAQQNRLEHTVDNESNVVENTTSAESLIRDTDMADEMVTYSLENLLMQAGQSMLAQANNSLQGVLALLQ